MNQSILIKVRRDGIEQDMFITMDDNGSSTLSDATGKTKNFTILSPDVKSIINLVQHGPSRLQVISEGYITEQMECPLTIINEGGEIPLGIINKEVPIIIGGIVVKFDDCVSDNVYNDSEHCGEIVLIDAR